MKILNVDGYLDGGTIKIVTDEEIYCIDSRIHTVTPGSIYLGYPKDDNSNMVSEDEQDSLREELKSAVEKCGSLGLKFDWKPRLTQLLKTK